MDSNPCLGTLVKHASLEILGTVNIVVCATSQSSGSRFLAGAVGYESDYDPSLHPFNY